MLSQPILPSMDNVTSSLASAAGVSRSASPGCPMTSPSGQAAVHVSRSVPPGKAKAPATPATSGQCSHASLRNAALCESLGSKLQARLGTGGLTEYRQTWKRKTTPAGLWYWAHTASARRISDSGCTGELGGWPTATLQDAHNTAGPSQFRRHMLPLNCAVTLARGQTPSGGPAGMANGDGRLAGWNTPRADEHSQRNSQDAGMAVSAQAGYPTPNWHDGQTRVDLHSTQGTNLNRDAYLWFADLPDMAGWALNPAFSLWLMGFPPEWAACGLTAMETAKKTRKRG